MFDEQAFQQDSLVESLSESGIIKRPNGDTASPLGFTIVNHSRNNNVKIQIKPKTVRPSFDDVPNQNPTTFIDDNRGTLNLCVTHANKFVISCAGAPTNFKFATSFKQMILGLYASTPNIEIILNGDVFTPDTFIKTVGTTRMFDSSFMTPYGLAYVDILGNYKLEVSGINTVRFEVRVNTTNNAMTPEQVQTLFNQATDGTNDTVVYHSNADFYGFTLCMESASIPSITTIDYATVETMDTLIDNGIVTTYNNDANTLNIATVTEGKESALAASFSARLLNEFEETPTRLQDFLLVLEASGIDLSTIDLSKVKITYSIYKKGS